MPSEENSKVRKFLKGLRRKMYEEEDVCEASERKRNKMQILQKIKIYINKIYE